MPLFLNTEKTITGNLTVTGYVTSRKSGVSAHVTIPAGTTITTAGTYYPIEGTFDNVPIEDFIIDVDKLKYIGSKELEFEVDWHASLSSVDGLRTVTVAIKKNSTVLTDQSMPVFCKTGGEAYPASGTAVFSLTYGDTVQLVCTSSTNLDVITFSNFITTIGRFFY